MFNLRQALPLLILLSACGGSGSSSSNAPATSSTSDAKGGSVPTKEELAAKDCECRVEAAQQGSDNKLTDAEKKELCADAEPNIDCWMTYGDSPDGCSAIAECSRGEPGRMPKCRDGYAPFVMNQCMPKCGASDSCPSGYACDKNQGDTPLCLPQ